MKWKKRAVGLMSLLVALAIVMVPLASVAGNERITITQNGYYMQKLSNPASGEGEADGLVTPGDRFNSYAWAMGELGDYIYVGTNRNLVGSTIEQYIHAYGDKIPMDVVEQFVDTFTNGELALTPEAEKDKGAAIVRYNKTTGEMETVFEPNANMPAPYNDITGYRMCVEFKGNLYFGSTGTANTMLLRVGPDFQPGDLPEILVHMTKPAETGMGNIRAYDVTDDGERLYIGGTDASLLSPEEIAEGVTSAVRIQTSTDGDHFETIAGPDDFYPYTLEKYISNSGDVWDLVVYQDVVYLSLMTTIGAVVYKGVEVGKGQPGANEYGWQWTEFIGDGLGKQGDPIYPAGFGNPLNYVMSPIVYKGDLYYYTLSNAFDSMVQAIFSLVKLVRNQDINAYFDGLKTMENSMKNQASIYRLTADGEMQMVMGSPDEYFNKENGNYLSETLHAFSNSTELGCMQYIWRAVEYNGKLFFGTFDASTLNHYFTFLTNGDLIGMTDESCEHLIRSAIDLINLLKKETVIDEGTTDTLVKVLGTLNSMVDKKATEATVRQLLEISLQFKKAFDKVSPLLDKLVNSDWAQAIGDKIEGINALRSIYNTLANIDTEGLERYIRISNAIMDAEQGFDLYTTEDGIHYTEILNDGLQDRYNYGSRSFIAGSDGLYVGTANPYYGGQLWKFNEITAELKSLSAEGFEIAFDPDVTTYDIAASADAEQIRLTAVGADPATKAVINGQETDGSEAVNVALQPGANVIRIETASIDGSETAVYTVNVARGEVPVTPEQTDPTAPSQPADSDGEQPAGGQTEASVPSSDQPSGQELDADIPATGAGMSVTMLAALVLGASGTMVFSRKKRR